MKKNYEKYECLIFVIIVFIVIESVICYLYFNNKYRTYLNITSIIVTDDYVKTYVDSKTLRKLNQSKYFYVDNKRLKYDVISIEKNIMKKNKDYFHEVMINFKIPKKYKDNDTINISIYSNKSAIYTIFKKCWESDV